MRIATTQQHVNNTALFLAATAVLVSASHVHAQPSGDFTLFAPNNSNTTYLINLAGVVQHTWPSSLRPGQAVRLLDNGSILRTANETAVAGFNAGGRGGRLQKISWAGALEWNYLLADTDRRQHHDAMVLPNGNILAIVWERKTAAQAIAAGRNPTTMSAGELWSDSIYEIAPSGATGGTIVWQWNAWDHLVQNFDATKPNFATPSSRPDRININYPAGNSTGDWLHCNGIDYNAELDQIVISSHNLDEIWIISHAPGASGDILYRWGNPAAYGLGTTADQKLFGQHNPQWIPQGSPGAGNILIYNNGLGRPAGAFSSVEEITTPLNSGTGTYARTSGQAFGPAAPAWSCSSASGAQFYSSNISGAQRLPNGNTLLCVGASGQMIEVNAACQTQWTYTNTLSAGNAAVFRATRIDQCDPRLGTLMGCPACDSIDFNGDNLFPDDADLVDLLTVLAGGACSSATCNDIDFNNDGLFPDDADLIAFLRVLAGGVC